MNTIKGYKNVCEPAVRYRYLKKLSIWCRTWFTIEEDGKIPYFQQHNAFSKDKNALWDKWTTSP